MKVRLCSRTITKPHMTPTWQEWFLRMYLNIKKLSWPELWVEKAKKVAPITTTKAQQLLNKYQTNSARIQKISNTNLLLWTVSILRLSSTAWWWMPLAQEDSIILSLPSTKLSCRRLRSWVSSLRRSIYSLRMDSLIRWKLRKSRSCLRRMETFSSSKTRQLQSTWSSFTLTRRLSRVVRSLTF